MIFILFLFSIFFRHKKSENCNTLSWVLYYNQFKPPEVNCFQFLNSIILNSHVSDNGGCICIQNKKMEIIIAGSSFIHSTSEKTGGALFLDIYKSDISNCCIQNCSSKEFSSSIHVASVDGMADNLISNSAITLCDCNQSTCEIIRGQQNIFTVNISNNHVKSKSSGILINTHHLSAVVFLLNVINNIGETTLDFQSEEVSEVLKSNFINNTNLSPKGYILISAGQWNFKHSIFLRNTGTNFLHLLDEIQFINCSLDNPIPSSSNFIVNNIHYVTDCPLNYISDLFNGFCPAYGTPTKPMPSPTPAKTPLASSIPTNQQNPTITPNISYSNGIIETSMALQKKQGLFSLLLLPLSIIVLAVITFMVCSSIIKPNDDMPVDNTPIMNMVDENDIIDPIEVMVLEEEEEEVDNGGENLE